MKTVLLERRLPSDLAAGDSPLPDGAICCTPAFLRWRASYVTADRSRAFLLAEAADLESIRMVLRNCNADVRWHYEIEDHVMDTAITPNMAFELLTTDRLDVDAIAIMVRDCAPDSTAVRILADVTSRSALVLARTPCRMLKPAGGVVLKSYQALTTEMMATDRHIHSLSG